MSTSNPSISPRERNPLSLLHKVKNRPPVRVEMGSEAQSALAAEPYFLQAMGLERKRAERSGKHFLLMLLAGEQVFQQGGKVIGQVTAALADSIRETDPSGWYRQGRTVGVIFTEVNVASADATQAVLRAKVGAALRSKLQAEDTARIRVSFHLFPEASEKGGWLPPNDGLSESQVMQILERSGQSTREKAKPVLL